jgi:hypothetical protein
MAGFTQNTVVLQKFDHYIDFREKRPFFAKNWQKSPKISEWIKF